jgi:hypothetical protein
MDGEVALQYLYTLPTPTSSEPTLLLPNSNLDDCCGDFKTLVLAYDDGSDAMKNDFTSFLNLCSPTTSDAVYKIYKDGVLKATLSGTTYGVNYAFGFDSIGVQKFVGYKIEWYKILALWGSGIYQIELNVTDAMLGNSSTFSDEYKLCEYRADRAEQTIRLDWWQSGTIGSMTNQKLLKQYSDLYWHQQIRLPGFFGYPETDGTKENVQYWNGQREWVTDEQEPIYKLKTKRIPSNLQTLLRVEVMTADACKVTDYNSKNAQKWVDFDVKFEPKHTPNWKPLISKLSDVELSCTQRFNNYRKHRS